MADRYSVGRLNQIFHKYKTDYILEEDTKKKEIYLVNTKTEKKTLIDGDYKNGTIGDETLVRISELINASKKEPGNVPLDWENPHEIYADLSAQKDIYGRTGGLEKTVQVVLIISSLLIIALTSLTITGNAVADSSEFTESAIFGLLIVLVISFLIFLRHKKKKK